VDTLTLERIIAYHRWVQEKLFRKAKKIPGDLLLQEAPLSNGSLLATLLHPVDTQWYWRSACEYGETPLDRLSTEQYPTVKAIEERWAIEQEKLEEYAASLTDEDLNASVTYSWPEAKPRSQILWHVLLHIVTHGVQHRAEAGQHMQTIGYSPGDLDFIIYCSKLGG